MKIGILTYYGVHSHGAVLQANALKRVLEKMGHEVCFITFERNYDYITAEQSRKYKISIASIPFYAKYLIEKGPSNILYNLKKNSILNDYRKKQFIMGPRYNEFTGDVVIVGSDEVFSLEIGLNPFMYGVGLQSKKIISYAACFGPTTIDDIQKKKVMGLISDGLKKFDHISARDMNTKVISEKLSGKAVDLVCDPAILYGYEKEMNEFIPKQDSYISVYSYDRNMNDPDEIDMIRAYAKKKGYKTIAIGYPHSWCDMNVNATPNELIGYIEHAKLVITDTFHGSVISIICNQNFIVKMRGNQNKLGYLLEEYGLSGRIVSDLGELEKVVEEGVNYDVVNSLITNKRNHSMEYLKEALR